MCLSSYLDFTQTSGSETPAPKCQMHIVDGLIDGRALSASASSHYQSLFA